MEANSSPRCTTHVTLVARPMASLHAQFASVTDDIEYRPGADGQS